MMTAMQRIEGYVAKGEWPICNLGYSFIITPCFNVSNTGLTWTTMRKQPITHLMSFGVVD